MSCSHGKRLHKTDYTKGTPHRPLEHIVCKYKIKRDTHWHDGVRNSIFKQRRKKNHNVWRQTASRENVARLSNSVKNAANIVQKRFTEKPTSSTNNKLQTLTDNTSCDCVCACTRIGAHPNHGLPTTAKKAADCLFDNIRKLFCQKHASVIRSVKPRIPRVAGVSNVLWYKIASDPLTI